MMPELNNATDTTLLLDSVDAITLRPSPPTPLDDEQLATTIRAQLAEPIHYPPLSQATVPGDRVVVAVGPGMPQLVPVLDGVLLALRDAGVEPQLTTVLMPPTHNEVEPLLAQLAELGHTEVQLKAHDPENEKESALLGVSQAGRALRLNQELCDADFVLPVLVTHHAVRCETTPLRFAGLLPDFSDRETIAHFSSVQPEGDTESENTVRGELNEFGQQLGVGVSLQIVPHASGQVAAAIAGDPLRVAEQAQDRYRDAWSAETETRGELVIATITGGPDQQTWHNVGRALAAAEAVLEPGGAIAIYSQLAEPPGRALGHLASGEDSNVTEREILRTPSRDRGPALQLCRALERGPVYLRSKLRPQVVESLGITPLESDDELEHLAQTMRPCLLLNHAQFLLPTVTEAQDA